MTKQQHIKEKQDILIHHLKDNPGIAVFGQPSEIAMPLVKKKILHRDTWKYTGGCTLTKQFREIESLKKWNESRATAEHKGMEEFNRLRSLFYTEQD